MSEVVIPTPEQEASAVHDRMLAETRKVAAEQTRLRTEAGHLWRQTTLTFFGATLAAAVLIAATAAVVKMLL